MIQSIQEIKANLIKRMVTVWNKTEAEIDDLIKFDPVIRLFFNAIVFQYEDIYHQHFHFKKEIMTDLANLLLPDVNYFAMPAFGVIEADPVRNSIFTLKDETIFSVSRKIRDKVISIKFIPIEECRLNPGALSFFVVGKTLVDLYARDIEKKGQYIKRLDNVDEHLLWFGIMLPSKLENEVNEITLFFDYDITDYEKRLYFNEMVNAEWHINDDIGDAHSGFLTQSTPLYTLEGTKRYQRAKQRILDFYQHNFISVKIKGHDKAAKNPPKLPEELKHDYKNVLWISAKCNAVIPLSFITEQHISVNAFPIMNCDLKSDAITSAEMVKGIQLDENEFYLDLKNSEGVNTKDFIVRNCRYKSFDSRDLAFELRTLVQLFNHSRSSFTKVNNIDEREMEIIRKFSDILSDMELQIKMSELAIPDLSIMCKEPVDRIKNYKYLTTYGELGNGGEPGELLKCDKPGLKEKSIVALTSFGGGKNPLKEHEMIDQYRYLLLSRDRIVTQQDMKALCFAVFGQENLEKVKISKTIIQGIGKVGLKRAIQIELELKEAFKHNQNKMELNKKELLTYLLNSSFDNREFLIEIY